MKNSIATELVKFEVLATTSDDQLISKAETLIDFQKTHDGFIDVELVKSTEKNEWYLIYHYDNLEKIKAVGNKLRSSKEFGEFVSLVTPESIAVSFYFQMKKW